MSSGERWRLGHRPALDGLRGVAIALVLLGHSEVPGFAKASAEVGVTLFFVLSGFLITALLLEERLGTGAIDFRRFYARRVRRLAPAFLVSVAVVSVAGALVAQDYFLRPSDVLLSLSYVGNWYAANSPLTGPLGVLAGTWSLAIEEQFYLVWPLLLAVVVGRFGVRGVAWFAFLGVTASLVERVLMAANGARLFRIYFGTDTNAVALLAGALIAALCVSGWSFGRLESRGALGAALVMLIGAKALHLPIIWLSPAAACAATVAVVAIGRAAAPWPSWLTSSTLTWLGRRSYAVYLWNSIFAVIAWRMKLPWETRVVVVAGLSLLVAELSWRFVETPFLVRRPRVLRHAAA